MSAEYLFGGVMDLRRQAQQSPYERWLRAKFPEASDAVLAQLAGIYVHDPAAPAEGKPQFRSTYRRLRNVATQIDITGGEIVPDAQGYMEELRQEQAAEAMAERLRREADRLSNGRADKAKEGGQQ